MHFDLITILGPTASGKTSLASMLAKDLNGEIISADSRQVYKGMDIGTGKDLIEFQKYNVSYHLIDIAEPSEEYNVFRFTKDFYCSFEEVKKKKRLPILVGGTGLYLSSIIQSYYLPVISNGNELEELDKLTISELKNILVKLKPKLHNITDLNHKTRIIKAILIERSRLTCEQRGLKLNSLNIGIKTDREETKRRITERLKYRLANGMIEEVQDLIKKGVSLARLNDFGLEYKFVSQYIAGDLNYNDMLQKLNSAIHTFAKKQMTWFRKMEREGIKINWFHPANYTELKSFVISYLINAT
jgi:tRNA dimethylallyltransferase